MTDPTARAVVVSVVDEASLVGVVDSLTTLGAHADNVWRGPASGFSAVLTDEQRAVLAARPDVMLIEADATITASATQPNPPWGLDRIDQRSQPLGQSYSPGGSGAGVTAYILDSGLWMTHTEFTGRIADSAFFDFGDSTGPWDCDGHGTHVAGVLGGTTYGVAKQVSIVPVKVLDCNGSGPTAALLGGISWIINHHTGGPAVVNMSLGGPAFASIDLAVEAMIADGITVVAAAGNDGAPTCDYSPGRVPAVITVAASTINDTAASYSNAGVCNDIFAPGSNILSAWAFGDSATRTISGTSMASPHVAGAAALVLADHPTDSPAEVWADIDGSSTPGLIDECCGEPDKLLFIEPAFPPLSTLTVNAIGVGSGTVSSSPAGIDACATSCSANFASSQVVTLTATPGPGSRFDHWGSGCAGTTPTCQVAINGPSTVTASFAPAAAFVAMNPARLFDSRNEGGSRPMNSMTAIPVSGRFGIPATTTSVALSVTVTEPSEPGYVTVYPCGSPRPTASNLNYVAGQTIPNAAIGVLGDGGAICVFNSGATHVVVDVNGWFPDGGGFTRSAIGRLLDTRSDPGTGVRPTGSTTRLRVIGGAFGSPAGAAAVALNVTVTEAQGDGYLTVYPCGGERPTASSLNYVTGGTIANEVIATVGDGGDICLYTSSATHVVVDISGWFAAGAGFGPLTPARLLDTRSGAGKRGATTVTEVVVAGRGGVPAGAGAVVLNVTVTEPDGEGFVTAYPCGTAPPTASNLNYSAGQTIPDAVFAKVGAGGAVCLYNSSPTHLVVDVNGWFPAAG